MLGIKRNEKTSTTLARAERPRRCNATILLTFTSRGSPSGFVPLKISDIFPSHYKRSGMNQTFSKIARHDATRAPERAQTVRFHRFTLSLNPAGVRCQIFRTDFPDGSPHSVRHRRPPERRAMTLADVARACVPSPSAASSSEESSFDDFASADVRPSARAARRRARFGTGARVGDSSDADESRSLRIGAARGRDLVRRRRADVRVRVRARAARVRGARRARRRRRPEVVERATERARGGDVRRRIQSQRSRRRDR